MKVLATKTWQEYRQLAEAEIVNYCEKSVSPAARGSEYLSVLRDNTDRLQGRLVLIGYDMLEGENREAALKAALAIEMLHAYVLCMDKGIDTDQALRAAHEAEIILANLEVEPDHRLKALSITNRTLMLATLARTGKTTEQDTLLWRATELTLNPLHVGQVLADADCHATNAVTDFALNLGCALLLPDQQAAFIERCHKNIENMSMTHGKAILRQLLQDTIRS